MSLISNSDKKNTGSVLGVINLNLKCKGEDSFFKVRKMVKKSKKKVEKTALPESQTQVGVIDMLPIVGKIENPKFKAF